MAIHTEFSKVHTIHDLTTPTKPHLYRMDSLGSALSTFIAIPWFTPVKWVLRILYEFGVEQLVFVYNFHVLVMW